MFPKRYVSAICPEYPELKFQLLANPDGVLFGHYFGDVTDAAAAAIVGPAMVEAYAGGRIEGYGVVLDFSTADAAIETLRREELPMDLRTWMRNAPIDIVQHQRSEIEKNFQRSLMIGS